ncbi:photosystem i p700 chlorophyll a apoprotein a1 [Phtheirospermum japonicum]|uniref:Photosystem i p700 chlorophyll a apoprotein a1 n=1 Tax=Phtheirospermum japonicum TaxID=374723 RepID=A0A830C783_9LAMI|nr:photosystem i p700 chlorophyll a apoprotein a1 [Phtheirospermum japonicum]
MWIGGFLIVGAVAHAAIFMVRDYNLTTRYNDLLDRVLRYRDAIISHLNWACIFLGFHMPLFNIRCVVSLKTCDVLCQIIFVFV